VEVSDFVSDVYLVKNSLNVKLQECKKSGRRVWVVEHLYNL
jgi:hypothetical protein